MSQVIPDGVGTFVHVLEGTSGDHAVVVEKRPVAQVARDYDVSRSWIYELLARYRAEGTAAFLVRHDQVVPASTKRPKSSYVRLEATSPNECWQSDVTHHRLAGGPDLASDPDRHVEIITWLDDHSRYALGVSAHRRVTAAIVAATFAAAAAQRGPGENNRRRRRRLEHRRAGKPR